MYRRCAWCGKGRTGWSGREQRTGRGKWLRLCFECWAKRCDNPSPRVVMREIGSTR